jgi:hypothetical protein
MIDAMIHMAILNYKNNPINQLICLIPRRKPITP